jgi:GNAT superfamily N-acetyltransferase
MMRAARRDELDLVVGWAADEGWNPGLDDASAFYCADPDGFFVAERVGRPVAAISVVNHSDTFAFLGLYLCLPAWRGQGIGHALWQHALAHAGNRSVGLDGVAAQQANYAKSGFVHAGATLRFAGTLAAQVAPDIRPARPTDDLAALDRAAFGYARPRFLSAWIRDTATRRTLVSDAGASAAGFATIRRCRDGVKIGPIVAPDAAAGLRLARAAVAALPARTAIIDVPGENAQLIALLAEAGFRETFATARMFRGRAPRTGPNGQAIGTMELG